MDKIKVVAYVDSDMVGDPDYVPSHAAPNTLLVPAVRAGEGAYADAVHPSLAPLDAVDAAEEDGLGPDVDRPRMWALFDRDGSDEEKIAALAEYLS